MMLSLILAEVLLEWRALLVAELLLLKIALRLAELASLAHLAALVPKAVFLISVGSD